MQKIILITGWTWYIWSHAVVEFEKSWYKTVILDNLSNSNLKTLNWIKNILWYSPDFFEIDLRNKEKLEEIFKKYKFDWVIHFAWLKAVWESCENPIKYFDNNVNWSIKLFEVMQNFWVENIIFSSSATVYDPKNISPLNENMSVWNTSNPYWTTKFLIENILKDLSKFSWFKVVNLRYFNPIWAHPSWEIWENPNWIPNNLLPFLMKVAKWELEELNVFWWDYNTKDWTWVRDYIDVNDLINWHIKAYNFLEKKDKWLKNKWLFETFNLWTWKWISVLEMIKIVEKITWKKIKYNVVWRREWDLAEVYCDNKKTFEILWFKCKVWIKESVKNSLKFIKYN